MGDQFRAEGNPVRWMNPRIPQRIPGRRVALLPHPSVEGVVTSTFRAEVGGPHDGQVPLQRLQVEKVLEGKLG